MKNCRRSEKAPAVQPLVFVSGEVFFLAIVGITIVKPSFQENCQWSSLMLADDERGGVFLPVWKKLWKNFEVERCH